MRKVSWKKFSSAVLSKPSIVFFIMNQEAESPLSSSSWFCLAMRRTRNSTSAGASMFSAVPPMVWSALRLMAANANSSENTAPSIAATSMASSRYPCSATQLSAAFAASNQPIACIIRTNSTPIKAPKIIIPSNARLMIPLRSAKMPASATTINGMA